MVKLKSGGGITSLERYSEQSTSIDRSADVFNLIQDTNTLVTAIIRTDIGKNIQMRWGMVRTLEYSLFDLSLFCDYISDQNNIYIENFILYAPNSSDFLFSGILEYPNGNVHISDIVVNTYHTSYLTFQLPEDVFFTDLIFRDIKYKLPGTSEYYSLYAVNGIDLLQLNTRVYTKPYNVSWSFTIREIPNYEKYRIETIANNTVLLDSNHTVLYIISSKTSVEYLHRLAFKDDRVSFILHNKLNDTYQFIQSTIDFNIEIFTTSEFFDVLIKSSNIDNAYESDTCWFVNYNIPVNEQTNSTHDNLYAYIIDKDNIQSYNEPITSDLFHVPYLKASHSTTIYEYVERIHDFNPLIHLYSDSEHLIVTNSYFLDSNLTLFRTSRNISYDLFELYNINNLEVYVLVESDVVSMGTRWLNIEQNIKIRMNDEVSDFINMNLWQYVHEDNIRNSSISFTLVPKSVIFTTPTYFHIRTKNILTYQLYTVNSFNSQSYHILQKRNENTIRLNANPSLNYDINIVILEAPYEEHIISGNSIYVVFDCTNSISEPFHSLEDSSSDPSTLLLEYTFYEPMLTPPLFDYQPHKTKYINHLFYVDKNYPIRIVHTHSYANNNSILLSEPFIKYPDPIRYELSFTNQGITFDYSPFNEFNSNTQIEPIRLQYSEFIEPFNQNIKIGNAVKIIDFVHSISLTNPFKNKIILPIRIDITFEKHAYLLNEPFIYYTIENDHKDTCYCPCCRMCCHCCKHETIDTLKIEYLYHEKITPNLQDIPVQKSIYLKNLFAWNGYEGAITNVITETFDSEENFVQEEFTRRKLYGSHDIVHIEETFDTGDSILSRPFIDFPVTSVIVTLFDNYTDNQNIILLDEPFNVYRIGFRAHIVPVPDNNTIILGDIFSSIQYTIPEHFVDVCNTQFQLSEPFFEAIVNRIEYLFDEPLLSELYDNPLYSSLYLLNQFKSGFLNYDYTPPIRHEIIFNSDDLTEPFVFEYDDCYCPPCPEPEPHVNDRTLRIDNTFDNNSFFF
tara:strand:- start:1845 stop:4889 length:3045 start_codon:yes stop_codon:yes gene_type:complete